MDVVDLSGIELNCMQALKSILVEQNLALVLLFFQFREE